MSAVVVKIKEFAHANLNDYGLYKATKATDKVALTETDVNVDILFSTNEVVREFKATTAFEVTDPDYLVAHVCLFTSSTPGNILVIFDDQELEGELLVS